MKDFKAKIKREKIEYPAWVGKGMEFEDQVIKVCQRSKVLDDTQHVGSNMFRDVVQRVYGGKFQNKLKRNLTIGEDKVFYFGYSDVEFDNTTIDIKTCMAWKGEDKYLAKNQHLLYLWMNGKKYFQYIVVEWLHENSNEINSVNIVDYTSPGSIKLESIIKDRTVKLFEFIRDCGLWHEYYFTFSKNK